MQAQSTQRNVYALVSYCELAFINGIVPLTAQAFQMLYAAHIHGNNIITVLEISQDDLSVACLKQHHTHSFDSQALLLFSIQQ